MKRRVVITGLGCVSPVGNNVKETWQALLDGKSGAAPITLFDASTHKTKFAAEVKNFDPGALFGTREARKMDRFVQMATAASIEAMTQSGLVIEQQHYRVGRVQQCRSAAGRQDARGAVLRARRLGGNDRRRKHGDRHNDGD